MALLKDSMIKKPKYLSAATPTSAPQTQTLIHTTWVVTRAIAKEKRSNLDSRDNENSEEFLSMDMHRPTE